MNNYCGWSLIELMISLLLSSLLCLALYQVYLSIKQFEQTHIALAQMQEHARAVSLILQQALRKTDYWGCRSLPDSAGRLSHENAINIDKNNVITLMHLATHNNYLLTTMHSTHELLATPSPTLKTNQLLMIADCQHSETFTAEAVQQRSKPIAQHVVSKTALHFLYPQQTYLAPVIKHSFYIATTSYLNQQGQAVLALFEKINDGQALELVPGIEKLNVEVGVMTTNHSIRFFMPTAVKAWQRVVIVKLHLLLNSINRVYGAAKQYSFAGKKYLNPDGLLHKQWDVTVVLINRINQRYAT